VVGFGIGVGVAVLLLHRASIVQMTLTTAVGAAAIAAIVPAVAFVVSVVPMPYRIIVERLDALEAQARPKIDDPDGTTVDLLQAAGIDDETAQIVGEP